MIIITLAHAQRSGNGTLISKYVRKLIVLYMRRASYILHSIRYFEAGQIT